MPDPASILPAVCHLLYTHLCYSLAMSHYLRHHYSVNLAGWNKMLNNRKALGEWFNQAIWLYAENLSPQGLRLSFQHQSLRVSGVVLRLHHGLENSSKNLL